MQFMQRALQLADLANPSPNPKVGAVIVKNNKIIAEGYHHKAGTPHAEINALNNASDSVVGATMYVTLEPCIDFPGKTNPPCVNAIINSGIKKVVVAMLDPHFPGKGVQILRDNGIEVEVGLLETEARLLNKIYIKFITTGRPYVLSKFACSIDGKISAAVGTRTFISCDESNNFVKKLRNQYSAVMVGIGTVLADNPTLGDKFKIIVDSNLRTPHNSNIFNSGNVIIATTINALNVDLNAKIIRCGNDSVDLSASMDELGKMNIDSILFEGGSRLNSSMFSLGLIDEVCAIISPQILGAGVPIVSAPVNVKLHNVSVKQCGCDAIISGFLRD